jgi:thioredoxin reductase
MKLEAAIIIGAGPAGLATALQLKRYGLDALVLERDQIGGLLRNANLVENYPGFPGGIPGDQLVRLFVEQAQAIAVDVTHEEVTELIYETGVFHVKTRAHDYYSRIVVIASGTRLRTLTDLHIPERLRDRVLYEIHSIAQVNGKRIMIVGAGDAAFDYALNLARNNDEDQVKCLPLLQRRAAASTRVEYRAQTRILELLEARDGGVVVQCASPIGPTCFQADYVIGAIGREPQLDFVSTQLSTCMDELEARQQLHLIGDVKNGVFRQTAIAVGDGILAAMKIYQSIKESSQ